MSDCQVPSDLLSECSSCMQVLDDRLKDHEWLAADQYTIADIANFSWVRSSSVSIRAPSAISGRPQPVHCPSVQPDCRPVFILQPALSWHSDVTAVVLLAPKAELLKLHAGVLLLLGWSDY